VALLTNGSAIQARFLAGSLLALAPQLGLEARCRYFNAAAFGQKTSWPVGYQDVTRARVPPLGIGNQVAARFGLGLEFTADLRGLGNITGTFSPEFNADVAANVLSNTAATFSIELGFDASILATGSMSATFDLISRPSANDISQEIWNSFAIEGGFTGADVLRIMLAALAGKVSGAETTTVTIRDTDDSKNRIVATVDASGNRSAVTLNAT